MVVPLIAVGGQLARRKLLKGAGKKLVKSKVGKAVSSLLGGKSQGKKSYKWTPEKGMKSLMKARIQGEVNKAKYGWLIKRK